MTALALTVASITDWKVITGGNSPSLPSRASWTILLCRASVSRNDCRAALTGNELYLNGLNSGRTFSQAALAKAGKIAGRAGEPNETCESSDPNHR